MDSVLKYWGLCGRDAAQIPSALESPKSAVWDVGDEYVLKYNPNTDELSHSIKLAGLLSAHAIPIAAYKKTTDGLWTSPDGAYCLMKKLKGVHIDFFIQTNVMKNLGKELAKLHIALADIEPHTKCHDNDFVAEWKNYIKPGLANTGDEIVDFIETRFFELYKKLPRQLIHRDVHANNILFWDGEVSGWLDFDISQRNVRIFDLAYLLGGLICGKTNDPAMVEIWQTLYRDLLTGYNSISPLSGVETEALPFMMIAIQLLFVAFWNGQGNAEQGYDAAKLAQWLYSEYAV